MLQNASLVAKIGADAAENERNFAKNLQLPYGCMRMTADVRAAGRADSRGPVAAASAPPDREQHRQIPWWQPQCRRGYPEAAIKLLSRLRPILPGLAKKIERG